MRKYQCTSCRRILPKRELAYFDDPQAPFGPEWLCPYCDSNVVRYVHPVIVGLAGTITAILGLAVGSIWSRW